VHAKHLFATSFALGELFLRASQSGVFRALHVGEAAGWFWEWLGLTLEGFDGSPPPSYHISKSGRKLEIAARQSLDE
jgi:hypothetical protein